MCGGVLFGQNPKCSDEPQQKALEANPALRKQTDEFNAGFQQWLKTADLSKFKASGSLGKTGKAKYIIPVVFHIVHNGGSENISEQTCADEITIMNRNYSAQNFFRSRIRDVFKDIEANVGFEFRLAKIDPNGRATTGVDRYYVGAFSYKANDYVKLGSWDPQRYLNIWVCGTISNGTPGVIGYCYFPTGIPSSSVDGPIVAAAFVGLINTSDPYSQKTTSHEVGHYFSLYHPWGSGGQDSCGLLDDQVYDTPPEYNPGNDVRNFCGHPDSSTCATDNPDLPDQYENIMDYFAGSCGSNMFTLQQAARMEYAINTYRKNLFSAENLMATGVADSAKPGTPIPVPSLFAPQTVACAGSTIQFYDNSFNGTITSYNWTFPGGNPGTATGKTPPQVMYANPGTYDVKLSVTGPGGTADTTFTKVVTIQPVGSNYAPGYYTADWDYQNDWQAKGWVFQNEINNNHFTRTSIHYDGNASMVLPGFLSTRGYNYSLISPAFNMTGASSPYFSFYYSFVQTTVTADASNPSGLSQDELRVYTSTDCGRTWTQRVSIPSNQIGTVGASYGVKQTVNYIPSDASKWKQVIIKDNQIPTSDNVKFKIEFRYNGGNNFYLDNVMLGMATGVSEAAAAADIRFSVQPNPFSSNATLKYELSRPETVVIQVYDMLGKELATLHNGIQQAGQQQVELNRGALGLNSGVYFVRMNVGNSAFTQKVIID